jgi:glycosyltransferase involved in cell wall biosynthesis
VRTITSVRNQTFKYFEYIIIDGGSFSSDGTLNNVNSNRDIINLVVSEKDKGINDSINKEIRLAKG